MDVLIKNATVVNEGTSQIADVLIQDDTIADIGRDIVSEEQLKASHTIDVVDASGCFLLPGIIDDHVHFRQPGLTQKADMASEGCGGRWGDHRVRHAEYCSADYRP